MAGCCATSTHDYECVTSDASAQKSVDDVLADLCELNVGSSAGSQPDGNAVIVGELEAIGEARLNSLPVELLENILRVITSARDIARVSCASALLRQLVVRRFGSLGPHCCTIACGYRHTLFCNPTSSLYVWGAGCENVSIPYGDQVQTWSEARTGRVFMGHFGIDKLEGSGDPQLLPTLVTPLVRTRTVRRSWQERVEEWVVRGAVSRCGVNQ